MLLIARLYLFKDLEAYIEIFNFEIKIHIRGSIINIANKNITSRLNQLVL